MEPIASSGVLSAVAKVFATFELLEHILFEIDTRTLLLAQRISRTWYKVIERSQKLQQKLFFRPASFREALELGLPPTDGVVIDPHDPSGEYWTDHPEETLEGRSRRFEDGMTRLIVLNPLIKLCRENQTKVTIWLNQFYAKRDPKIELMYGSWTRMYLSHPSPSPIFFDAARRPWSKAKNFGLPKKTPEESGEEVMAEKYCINWGPGTDDRDISIVECILEAKDKLEIEHRHALNPVSSSMEIQGSVLAKSQYEALLEWFYTSK